MLTPSKADCIHHARIQSVSILVFSGTEIVDWRSQNEKIDQEIKSNTKDVQRHLLIGQAAKGIIQLIYCFELQNITTTLNKYNKETHETRLKALKVIAKAKTIDFQLRPKMEGLKNFKIKIANYEKFA